MVNQRVAECRSIYHGETTVPAFSFPTKYDDRQNNWIRFVKDRQPSLIYLLFLSATLKKSFLKNRKKARRNQLIRWNLCWVFAQTLCKAQLFLNPSNWRITKEADFAGRWTYRFYWKWHNQFFIQLIGLHSRIYFWKIWWFNNVA